MDTLENKVNQLEVEWKLQKQSSNFYRGTRGGLTGHPTKLKYGQTRPGSKTPSRSIARKHLPLASALKSRVTMKHTPSLSSRAKKPLSRELSMKKTQSPAVFRKPGSLTHSVSKFGCLSSPGSVCTNGSYRVVNSKVPGILYQPHPVWQDSSSKKSHFKENRPRSPSRSNDILLGKRIPSTYLTLETLCEDFNSILANKFKSIDGCDQEKSLIIQKVSEVSKLAQSICQKKDLNIEKKGLTPQKSQTAAETGSQKSNNLQSLRGIDWAQSLRQL